MGALELGRLARRAGDGCCWIWGCRETRVGVTAFRVEMGARTGVQGHWGGLYSEGSKVLLQEPGGVSRAGPWQNGGVGDSSSRHGGSPEALRLESGGQEGHAPRRGGVLCHFASRGFLAALRVARVQATQGGDFFKAPGCWKGHVLGQREEGGGGEGAEVLRGATNSPGRLVPKPSWTVTLPPSLQARVESPAPQLSPGGLPVAREVRLSQGQEHPAQGQPLPLACSCHLGLPTESRAGRGCRCWRLSLGMNP